MVLECCCLNNEAVALPWLCWMQVECSTAKEHIFTICSTIVQYRVLNHLKGKSDI